MKLLIFYYYCSTFFTIVEKSFKNITKIGLRFCK